MADRHRNRKTYHNRINPKRRSIARPYKNPSQVPRSQRYISQFYERQNRMDRNNQWAEIFDEYPDAPLDTRVERFLTDPRQNRPYRGIRVRDDLMQGVDNQARRSRSISPAPEVAPAQPERQLAPVQFGPAIPGNLSEKGQQFFDNLRKYAKSHDITKVIVNRPNAVEPLVIDFKRDGCREFENMPDYCGSVSVSHRGFKRSFR